MKLRFVLSLGDVQGVLYFSRCYHVLLRIYTGRQNKSLDSVQMTNRG